tara:strand:- start:203 stop:433 length:231 start_codon:yes stop_codon:yes gene_type:complete
VQLEDLVVEDLEVVEQVEQVIHLLCLPHKGIMVVLRVVPETVVVAEAVQVELVQMQVLIKVEMEETEQQQILQEVH